MGMQRGNSGNCRGLYDLALAARVPLPRHPGQRRQQGGPPARPHGQGWAPRPLDHCPSVLGVFVPELVEKLGGGMSSRGTWWEGTLALRPSSKGALKDHVGEGIQAELLNKHSVLGSR